MKMVRIETRSGRSLFASLAPYPDLPSWIAMMRRDGWCIGPQWAIPFAEIALAEIVEIHDTEGQSATPEEEVRRSGHLNQWAAGIAAGQIRPVE